MEGMELIIFNIISNAGNAKGYVFEALDFANEGKYKEAEDALREADDLLKEAHKSQTQLIQAEAGGEKTELSILLIHAQDHLMTAMETRSLANYFIKLNKKIDGIKE